MLRDAKQLDRSGISNQNGSMGSVATHYRIERWGNTSVFCVGTGAVEISEG
jgi:hypothetical protein